MMQNNVAYRGFDFLKDTKTETLREFNETIDSNLIAFFEIHFEKKIKEMALGILSESQETCTMEKINYTKGIAQGIREVRNFFHAIRDEYKKRIKANDER